MEVLKGKVGLYDARGLDPGPEDVLLSGLVVGCPNPVQAVQVAGRRGHTWVGEPLIGLAELKACGLTPLYPKMRTEMTPSIRQSLEGREEV